MGGANRRLDMIGFADAIRWVIGNAMSCYGLPVLRTANKIADDGGDRRRRTTVRNGRIVAIAVGIVVLE